jgi:acetylornithine deacetylase/succinyl-diaminopimelate desuccinylase-like protein
MRMLHRISIIALAVLILITGDTSLTAQQHASLASSGQPPLAHIAQLIPEAQDWLINLVRIDTTNPPGGELEAAKYVAQILERENIPSEVIELAPGRGVAIGRLQAGPLPDSSRALLLLGHLDVVGVDRPKWTQDPFGAAMAGGYLYGRGAVDDKAMVAANLATIVALKRSGVRLNRDVIFLASADEEEFGPASIKVLIEKHWDKIACAYAINEGGRVVMRDGKVHHVAIQTSEKVPRNVSVIASGSSGHASIARRDNAIARLATALQKISTLQTPAQPSTVTRRYFEQLARIEDEEIAKWMRALEMPERADLAARRLSDHSPLWNSMLRDSITPTELRAGIRSNVVPSDAWANLNIRLLPGNSLGPVLLQMEKLVNDPLVQFRPEAETGSSAPDSSHTSELYQLIERKVTEQFPDAIAVPFLSTGATDSSQLRLHNVQAYGLLPFPLTEADESRIHGDDERIPLASFQSGTEFLYSIVREFVAAN